MNIRHPFLMCAVMAVTVMPIRPASALPCSASSPSSGIVLAKYKSIAATTDPILANVRQARGLPAISAAAVVMVTDTAICRQAIGAYNNALAPDSATTTQLHVIRFGSTRYVVFDELRKAGEWIMSIVFDPSFSQIISRGSE